MSHGKLAEGVLDSAGCIFGQSEGIETLTLGPADDIDVFEEKMHAAIAGLDQGEGVLILVDLLGGTPSNKSVYALRNENVEILTGLNLPMLLAALEARMMGANLKELEQAAKAGAKDGIVDLRVQLGL